MVHIFQQNSSIGTKNKSLKAKHISIHNYKYWFNPYFNIYCVISLHPSFVSLQLHPLFH